VRLALLLPPAVALSLAPAAAAQTFDGTQGVDTFTGPVISPARITGLGGAFVGVAEGLEGAQANPAAVAQRSRRLDRAWDWDWLLTWYVPDPRDVVRQDLGNDGQVDSSLSGLGNAQLGLSLQLGRLGVGIFGRGWNLAAPRGALGDVEVEKTDASLAFGWAALRDSLVLGASVTAVSGTVSVVPAGAPPDAEPTAKVEYSGTTLRFGALWRPRGLPWRLGASFHPLASARAKGDRSAVPVTTPARFVFPAELSLGASAWLGPNARRYNEPPPYDVRRHPEWGPEPEWEATERRPVLVSAQVDVAGKSPDSVTVESVLEPSGEAVASGESVSVSVRVGAEWEPLAEWLRVRGGTYLEPSRTGSSARPHLTFGAEGRIPFFRGYDLKLGLAGDVAERFRNVSLSVGFWSSYAPQPPVSIPR
jgi:hypothetical protein